MKKGKTRVFTDGASHGNPGPGGWGVIVHISSSEVEEYCGGAADVTNSRMEVKAAYKALRNLHDYKRKTEVYSDSSYVVDTVRKGWYKKWDLDDKKCTREHADLWRKIVKMLSKFDNIEFFHIKAHLDLDDEDEVNEWHKKFNVKHGKKIGKDTFKWLIERNHEVDRLASKRVPD